MPANLENSAVATGLEKVSFIPVPKKGNAKECSNYCKITLMLHAGKVMLKILQETRIPDHLICLMRNLYAGQEATVRTGYGTTDWFQIRKGVHQSYILSPFLIYLICRVHHEKP